MRCGVTKGGFDKVAVSVLTLSQLARGLPTHARDAKVVKREELRDAYDFVVVGAGTAGLTVADRLSESGECKYFALTVGIIHKGEI